MSTNPAEGKKKLSKHILEMKFMQRGAIREEHKLKLEEDQRVIDDEHWVLDLPLSHKTVCSFITEPSFAVCEHLIFGRRSYKGFNADIEKLCKVLDSSPVSETVQQNEHEKAVNDEEMAARYSSLVGTIAKKFKKRRGHSIDTDSDLTSAKKLKVKDRVKKFLNPEDSTET